MENINQEPMSSAVVDDQVPARCLSPTRSSSPPPTPDAPAKKKNKWSVRHSRHSNKGAMNPRPVPGSMFPRFLDLFGVGRQDEEEEEQQPREGQKKREPGTFNDPRDYTESRLPYFSPVAPKKCRKGKAVRLSSCTPAGATAIPKPHFYKGPPCRELFGAVIQEVPLDSDDEDQEPPQQQEEPQLLVDQEEPQLLGEQKEQPEEEEEEEQPEEEEEQADEQPGEEEEEEPEWEDEEEEPEWEDEEEEEPEWELLELLEWELPQQHLQEPQGAAAAPTTPPPRQHRIRAVSRRHNGSMPVRKGLF